MSNTITAAATTAGLNPNLPSFTSFGTTILTILGSLLMIVVTLRIFTAYAQKKWGEMVIEIVAVLFVGWFIWFPDNATSTIKALVSQIFG